MSKPVQQSLEVLKQAQREINKLLSDPLHVHNVLTLNGLFDRITARLTFMGGVVEPDLRTNANPVFPPITNFMGEIIKLQPLVEQSDLNPKEHERLVFRAKVQKLYDQFIAMGSNAVLKSFTIPEDVLVVRGVAKWAGIHDYETREMNMAFMEQIAEGIAARKAITDKQTEIDIELQRQDQLKNLDVLDIPDAVVFPGNVIAEDAFIKAAEVNENAKNINAEKGKSIKTR